MKHSDPATPPNANGIVFGFALVVLVFGTAFLASAELVMGMQVISGGIIALGYSLSPQFLSQSVAKGVTRLRTRSIIVIAIGGCIGALSLMI
mgnify:CR=1 FL=1